MSDDQNNPKSMIENKPTEKAEASFAPCPCSAAAWTANLYGSGTQTVSRGTGAWYHIGHLAADNDGDHGRYDVTKELEAWLNGGNEPWWLELLRRQDERTVITPHGCQIQATGPMVDEATPPSWGCWREDDSADAKIERGLLTDALMKRRR